MPHFIDAREGRIVSTSYKVMYTTLRGSAQLEFINADRHHELLKLLAGAAVRGKRPDLVLLARNPYDRVVSFFCDKFGSHPKAHAEPGFCWQECQRVFWPYMALDAGASCASVAESMLGTCFQEFVSMLGRYFRDTGLDSVEPHLAPQYLSLQWVLRAGRFRIGVPFAPRLYRVVRIEDENALRAIHDPADRQNATSHGAYREYLDPGTFAVVNELYREDFRRLGYPMQAG